MRATVFQSHPLPRGVAAALQRRLEAAHRAEPFSALDPRAAVRRVIAEATDLGLGTMVYRGGLDLQGAEVDHVWLALEVGPVAGGDQRKQASPYVVDVAFPLFMQSFVDALRRFVAGDAEAEELAALAARAGLDERVVGVFPAPLRYVGAPLWSVLERRRSREG
jgi:hypothetical protein